MSRAQSSATERRKVLPAVGVKLTMANHCVLEGIEEVEKIQRDLMHIKIKLEACLSLIREIRSKCFSHNFFDSNKRKSISGHCDRMEAELRNISKRDISTCRNDIDLLHAKLMKLNDSLVV